MAVCRGSPDRRLLQLLGVVVLSLLWSSQQALAQDCSATLGCANNLCCSQWGYCGDTEDFCSPARGCSNNCWSSGSPNPPSTPGTGSGSGVGSIVTEGVYNQIFPHTNDASCSPGFYTYSAFISAANSFQGFGTAGDDTTNKRELAAFLAQVSHETTGGWASAPDGPYAWGLCFKKEAGCPDGGYCDSTSTQYPCAGGKSYCGRGPMQLSWNYNYGPAGNAIGVDLLGNPELVENDSVVSWKTAIWFWMTPQSPKPSAHAVMAGQWTPSAADQSSNRLPGFGVTTNIINGGLECGHGSDNRVLDRIGYFQRYTGILGVSTGDNVDCATQAPWI